jgi:hypothetical protein
MAQRKALNPAALTLDEAAKTLGVPREWIEEDLDAGAPRNADGTVNLVQYAAWLNLALRESDNGEA